MIGKDHRIDLYRIDKIGIVTDQSGELCLSNLVQLLKSEGRWLVRQLVPKSVTATRMTELRGDQAGEGWPEHTTRKWSFGYAARP